MQQYDDVSRRVRSAYIWHVLAAAEYIARLYMLSTAIWFAAQKPLYAMQYRQQTN
jgi:hypothetical protein